ncbi:cation transporter [Peribacillus frigoritolerans]
MDCPACAKTIEKGLSTLKDIAEVKVNYMVICNRQFTTNKIN